MNKKVLERAIKVFVGLPYIVVFILFLSSQEGEYSFLFIGYTGVIILMISFYVIKDTLKTKRSINLENMTKLDAHMYHFYKEETEGFKSVFIKSGQTMKINTLKEMQKFESFLLLLSKKKGKYIRVLKTFEELNESNPKFLDYTLIISLYYLLEGESGKFCDVITVYKDRIKELSQSEILSHSLITLNNYKYYLPIELVDTMYDVYQNNKELPEGFEDLEYEEEINRLFHTYILYHYYEETENKTKLSDLQPRYNTYQQKRNRL